MSKELRYIVNGKKVTRLEAIQYYTEQSSQYEEPEKSYFLAMIMDEFKSDQKMDNTKTKFQTIGVPIIGVVLLLFSLYVSFLVPNPSKYQSGVFWVLLSIATAMSAVMITGNIEFNYSNIVKAGGTIAIFCIMYFYVPTIYDKTKNSENSKLTMFVVTSDSSGVQKLNVDFDRNNSGKVKDEAIRYLSHYTGSPSRPNQYTCYRKSDGKIYTDELCSQLSEFEILMISSDAERRFTDKRQVYLYYKSIADSISLQSN